MSTVAHASLNPIRLYGKNGSRLRPCLRSRRRSFGEGVLGPICARLRTPGGAVRRAFRWRRSEALVARERSRCSVRPPSSTAGAPVCLGKLRRPARVVLRDADTGAQAWRTPVQADRRGSSREGPSPDYTDPLLGVVDHDRKLDKPGESVPAMDHVSPSVGKFWYLEYAIGERLDPTSYGKRTAAASAASIFRSRGADIRGHVLRVLMAAYASEGLPDLQAQQRLHTIAIALGGHPASHCSPWASRVCRIDASAPGNWRRIEVLDP